MKNILASATKIVLLLFASALFFMALFACVVGILRDTLQPTEVLSLFNDATLLVLGFYFAYKGESKPATENKETAPYAGK
jgi:putative Ca2+/H+ antiporter (TMEM165/GDT1 family)